MQTAIKQQQESALLIQNRIWKNEKNIFKAQQRASSG